MPSRRVQRRWGKIPPLTRVASAASGVIREAICRSLFGTLDNPEQRATSSCWDDTGRELIILGQAISHRGEIMLDADRDLDESRARHRQARARRQRLVRRLYRLMVDVRRSVKGVLGREMGCHYFRHLTDGPTSRDPESLHLQARRVAARLADPRTAPRPRRPILVNHNWLAIADDLLELSDELQQVLTEVAMAARGAELTLRDQRRAIADFDGLFIRGARYLEALLQLARLPTLAAQVRPGVGQRGRPPKVRPVDAYPDLLARALDVLDLETRHAAPDGEVQVSEGAEKRSPVDLRGARNGVPGTLKTHQKIAQGVRKLPAADQKIAQAVDKLAGGHGKSEQGVRECPQNGEKSHQGLRKWGEIDLSSPESAVASNRPLRKRRIVLGLANHRCHRAAAPRIRPAKLPPPPVIPPPIQRVQETVSAWWERIRRAA